MNMAHIKNLSDILVFLDYLRENRLKFRSQAGSSRQYHGDVFAVVFPCRGRFFEDHVEYSYFVGDESVKSDLDVLDLIIKEEPAKLKALGILPASI